MSIFAWSPGSLQITDLIGNHCALKLTFNKDDLIALHGRAVVWEKYTVDS